MKGGSNQVQPGLATEDVWKMGVSGCCLPTLLSNKVNMEASVHTATEQADEEMSRVRI